MTGTLDAIREALEAGRLMEAVDAARDHLEQVPGDTEALYLKALALSRLGAGTLAADTLGHLLAHDELSEGLRADALALQGRLIKDRLLRSEGVDAALALQASRCYEQADTLRPSAFFAVNAATLHRVAGDKARASALAHAALTLVPDGDNADYWDKATRGECALLLGNVDEAVLHYRSAARRAGSRYGDLASMRRQLRLLARVVPEAAAVQAAVVAPKIVAFSGHMVDAPGRAVVRFPAALAPAVRAAIDAWLDRVGPVIGYSQAACGSDILFLEALQARGYETHVTLPCATQDYLRESVSFAGGDWEARFHAVTAAATSVAHATAEAYLGDQVLFQHASRFIDGRAILRARELETDAVMLVVLDLESAGGAGGTLETLEEWRRDGREGEVIDLGVLRRAATLPPVAATATPRAASAAAAKATVKREICGLVFGDVRGFSKLTEEYSPRFQERFLGEARAVIDQLGEQFRTAQTAGDGIYATFASGVAAAEFSLRLQERVGQVDWTAFGMPADTHVRLAVHCGPAFPIQDPVTRQPNFCGSHVNRTARIEPIVTPGQVFVTEVVAAYLALYAPHDYACDYLGVLPLAKGFGSAPLYRLRRPG